MATTVVEHFCKVVRAGSAANEVANEQMFVESAVEIPVGKREVHRIRLVNLKIAGP